MSAAEGFVLTAWVALAPSGINGTLYEALNGLAGRSGLVDGFAALLGGNDLLKGVPIGACFLAAWYGARTPAGILAARKALLGSLLAVVVVVASTKALSYTLLLPRPFVLSSKVYRLADGELSPYARVRYRVPLDDASRDRHGLLLRGNVVGNHLGTFPSDHAGFLFTISMGIGLASRRLGLIAIGWTLAVLLIGKVMLGMHTPADVAGGAAVALAGTSLFALLAAGRLGLVLDRAARWSVAHPGAASALLFPVVFEIAATLEHVPAIVKFFLGAARGLLAGGGVG